MRRIRAAGYRGVDIFTGTPHLEPRDYNRDERKKVLKLAQSLGLKITGLALNGGRLNLGLNFSNPREVVRARTLQYYKENIDLAEELRCPMINILTGLTFFGTSREQGRQWTMDALQDLVDYAEKREVMLGLHPQVLAESPFIVTIDDALEIIQDLKSKVLRIIFDTSQQYLTNANLADDIRKARKYLSYVHLNDNDGARWLHWPPGRGVINWIGLFRALKEIDFKGWVCCQIFSDSPTDIDAWIVEARDYVSQVMKRVGFK